MGHLLLVFLYRFWEAKLQILGSKGGDGESISSSRGSSLCNGGYVRGSYPAQPQNAEYTDKSKYDNQDQTVLNPISGRRGPTARRSKR